MQNRLKSRVWDPQEKVMHYNDFVITSTGYVAKCENLPEAANKNGVKLNKGVFLIDQTNLDFDKKMVVMQCTGLEDENSQLIYAGDILEVTVFDIEGHDFQFICEAFVGDYGITFDEINKGEEANVFSVWNHNFTSDDLKILGNKYENPELLEGGGK